MSILLRIHIIILCFIVFVNATKTVSAQSLDNISEQAPFSLSGSVSTNQVISMRPADTSSTINYSSYYTGNLNFSFYGVHMPITYMYSNNQGNFTHPFNQFGMHPSYKWVKGHIGYASMSFSPYTLNGHLFLGTGVEVDPEGVFYGKAFYGRLQRAVPFDSTLVSQVPAYQRMGYGVKVGIAEDGNFVDINMLRAYDVENSLHFSEEEMQVLPQENSVMSFSFSKQLVDNLVFKGEYASSYLSTDMRTDEIVEKNILLKPPVWFMPVTTSTIQRNALKSNITYTQNRYSVGVGYERVDPDYKTLGAYYFTNNMENTTLNFSVNFFDNSVSISGNTGLQKNNLDGNNMNNTNRFVGSGAVNYVPGEKYNLNLSYSNFTSYTNVRSTFDYINEIEPYQNYDTLDYRQISQNMNFNGSYQISKSDKLSQNLNVNLTRQASHNEQGTDSISLSRFYNVSTAYSINITPLALTCNASVNYNQNDIEEANSQTIGPVLGVSKMLFDKTLRTSLTTSYSVSQTENFPSSSIATVRFGLAYTLKKKHTFNTNILFQYRENQEKTHKTYNFTCSYAYNFNLISQNTEKSDNGI
jgi:hypothetical protein